MLRRFISILIIVLISLHFIKSIKSQEQRLFTHLTVDDGLAQMSVTDILQDTFGFIWFATGDGLCMYDGYNFKTFRHNPNNPNSLSNSHVRVLCEGQGGDIWIGTWGGGLDKYSRATNTFSHYKNNPNDSNSISSNFIKGLCIEDDSLIWVSCSYGSLTKFNFKNNTFVRYNHISGYPTLRGDAYLFSVKVDKSKTVWLCTGSGLYALPYKNRTNGKFLRFGYTADVFKQIDIGNTYDVMIAKDQTIWVASYGDGLFRLNPQTYDFKLYKNDPKNENSLSHNKVTGLAEDSDGNIWITTFGGGLCCLNPKTDKFSVYKHNKYVKETIAKNFLLKVFIDRQSVLWVGTYTGGVSKVDLTRRGIKHYKNIENNENSLLGNSVNAMLVDSSNRIWIATADGGLNTFDPITEKFTRFENNSTLSQMYKGKNNVLWYGSFYGGFFQHDLNSNKITNYRANEKKLYGFTHNRVTSICEGDDGIIWLGMARGLRYWNRSQPLDSMKIFEFYKGEKTKNMINVSMLIVDKRKNLWIGSEEGLKLMNYKTKEVVHFRKDEKNKYALKTEVVNTLFEDSRGLIWVGTDIGIYIKPKPDTSNYYIYFDIADKVPNVTINAIEEDAKGNMWFSTNQGIFCIDVKNKTIRTLSVIDGLQGHEFLGASCFYKPTGELFFGGRNGFNRFHPDSIQNNPFPPQVSITDFYLFNKIVPIGSDILPKNILLMDEINLSYRDYVFSFSFSGLHYADPMQNQYAYILEGFDKQWNYTNATRRYVTYTKVPAGTYIFKVKASNGSGVFSDNIASIRIVIAPPFWETWWFRGGVLILLGLLIFAFIKYRERNLKKQKTELERLVDKRTAEVVKQKEEIMEKNEELNQQREEILTQNEHLEQLNMELTKQSIKINVQNKKITDSIKYAQQIQSALFTAFDNIKNDFPESFVFIKPKDIVSGDFFYYNAIGAYQYFAVVDCTGHGVPGAFMSIIGLNLLNRALYEEHLSEPNQILEFLNEEVRKSLYGKGKQFINDGMDMVVCRYCKATQLLSFSGAINSLYHVRNGLLNIYKTDNHHIGLPLDKTIKNFSNHELQLLKGDMIYLFTDGYADQFNEEGNQKFSLKKFKDLLLDCSKYTCNEQLQLLESNITLWKKDAEQVDDMLVLGIRIE